MKAIFGIKFRSMMGEMILSDIFYLTQEKAIEAVKESEAQGYPLDSWHIVTKYLIEE